MTPESISAVAPGNNEFPIGFKDAFSGHLKPERSESSLLFRNLGGNKFADVTKPMGIDDRSWNGDAGAIDLNSDGWVDLYLLNMQGDDQIYLNRDGKSFERVSRELFPKTPWGAMSIKAFDFENDGDLDIYITDMHSDMSVEVSGAEAEKSKADMQWTPSYLKTEGTSIFGNAFYRHRGDGTFVEVSDQIGAENFWPWGLSVDDLNADGFEDAFVTASMNFPFRYSINSVLLNEAGTGFRDSEFILGVEPRAGGSAAPWFEMDPSGKDRSGDTLELLKTKVPDLDERSAKFVVWSALGSRSSVIFDLDDDGDLDIVTNELNHYPMVLLSDLAERNADLSYLKVKLVGTKSNRSALGATVRIKAGEVELMKVKDGQSGYLSHSDFPLYFGLGGAAEIDQIEVNWPSGGKQVVGGPIGKNQLLTITEEGG